MHVDTDKRDSADDTARRRLLRVLLAGLLVQIVLLVAMANTGVHIDDERDYVELARSIHGSHEFPVICQRFNVEPSAGPLWRIR